MKVTKTSIHRLTIEKTCGCQATREYEDIRYTKPLAEGSFVPCQKHNKGAVAEFAGEMLIEALDKEAETAGKTVVVARETVTAMAGTTGGSVTSMGSPRVREKVDPLKPRTASFDRPNLNHPQNVNYGNLNVAAAAQLTDEELAKEEITITGDIDGVPNDPRVDRVMEQDLEGIEDMLDEDDVRTGGVSKTLVDRFAVD